MNSVKTTPASLQKSKLCLTTIGKINTSSTSKIKKTTATRKNRSENGRRGIDWGVNPHSNGLLFSRSEALLLPSLIPNTISKPLNRLVPTNSEIKNIIT